MQHDQIIALQSRSRMVHSALVNAACALMALGGASDKWDDIYAIHQLNIAMDTQVRAGDYVSDTTLGIYKKLQCFVGSQFSGDIPFNPNAELPGVTIQRVNPVWYVAPEPDIPYEWFDPTDQDGDGGRDTFFKDTWKGFDPVLSIISPAESALKRDVDYVLVDTGGIRLISTGNLPKIYPGGHLRASNYVKV